jgi:hypothetical protein
MRSFSHQKTADHLGDFRKEIRSPLGARHASCDGRMDSFFQRELRGLPSPMALPAPGATAPIARRATFCSGFSPSLCHELR